MEETACVDKLKEYKKKYYLDNKEKIKAKFKEESKCPRCGKIVKKYYIKQHQTKKTCVNSKFQKTEKFKIFRDVYENYISKAIETADKDKTKILFIIDGLISEIEK